jgi:2-succinyl-5-enolpyruvyl-6-hydroxy-3-cyclohexene-1-carboxylate synthase
VRDQLTAHPLTTGLHVAAAVAAAVRPGDQLVLGASNPVRDAALVALDATGVKVQSNRGVAGIDGTVSTAVGAALVHEGPSYALMGDLTFLHDSTGLVIGPAEPRPDLALVVVNDDGGGLFTQLEQGAPEHAEVFERVFGTPHRVDLAALCAATSTPYALADSLEGLRGELRPRAGLRVVEVRTERSATRGLHTLLRAAVDDALG